MQQYFSLLLGTTKLSLATGAHAASALTVYSAAEPIALVDVSGAIGVEVTLGLKKSPSGATGK